ncbi:permease-related [Anaeramoeba flamelloides]|uniref:Permease-related n=1 Tax=Anaeramoeba flamelloides TaxID=1746091 RepID=A0ABQ8X4P9_9EUKA|nr:permease-related [Anaeramoeba flamelloides]
MYKINPLFVVISGAIISLHCGAPNIFATFSSDIQADLKFSDTFISILTSFGMIGLYFTIFPAGWANDRVGPRISSTIGGICCGVGYFLMSYQSSHAGIFIMYLIASFGIGTSFICSLGSSGLVSRPDLIGVSISCVGAALSLSIAYYVQVLKGFTKAVECKSTDCWRWKLRFIGILTFVVLTFFSLFLAPKPKPKSKIKSTNKNIESEKVETGEESKEEEKEEEEESSQENVEVLNTENDSDLEKGPLLKVNQKNDIQFNIPQITFKQSLLLLKTRSFWILFFAYFVGVASGIFVLGSSNIIWSEYRSGDNESDISNSITIFSIFNCLAGVLGGVIGDYFKKKKINRNKYYSIICFIIMIDFIILCIVHEHHHHTHTYDYVYLFFTSFLGLSFGTSLTITPTIVSELYGTKNFGIIFGYLQISSSVAAVITPIIDTKIHDRYSLLPIMIFFAIAQLLCSVLLFFFMDYSADIMDKITKSYVKIEQQKNESSGTD